MVGTGENPGVCIEAKKIKEMSSESCAIATVLRPALGQTPKTPPGALATSAHTGRDRKARGSLLQAASTP